MHLNTKLKCTVVIMLCLSSTHPSICTCHSLTFHILYFSKTAEQNLTKGQDMQEGSTQHPLPSVCFMGQSVNKDGGPGLWLTCWLRKFWELCNCRTEFGETWQKTRSQLSLPNMCFLGQSVNKHGHPGLWLAETVLTLQLGQDKLIVCLRFHQNKN